MATSDQPVPPASGAPGAGAGAGAGGIETMSGFAIDTMTAALKPAIAAAAARR